MSDLTWDPSKQKVIEVSPDYVHAVRWTQPPAEDEEYAASVYRDGKPMTTLLIRSIPTGGYGIHVDDDPDILGNECRTLEEAVRRADSYISGYLAALEIVGGDDA